MLGQRRLETVWATLKIKLCDRYLWPVKAAAKLAVGDWIERVYNRRKRHSAIRMIPSAEYANRLTQNGASHLTMCPPYGVKPTL